MQSLLQIYDLNTVNVVIKTGWNDFIFMDFDIQQQYTHKMARGIYVPGMLQEVIERDDNAAHY
jgi:hypothetical protein